MKNHEFFQKYANVPMSMRFTPISFKDAGNMTLHDCYTEISKLEDQIRPLILKRDALIEIARPVLERF